MHRKNKSLKKNFDRSIYQAITNEKDPTIFSQESQKYVYSKKEVYSSVLNYLESSDCSDDDFQHLIKIIDLQQYDKSDKEYEQFLYMIERISNNHHRDEIFLKKIFQILQYYKNQIKQTLLNFQIFNIFRTNKMLLLFLIDNDIIKIDENIFREIDNTYDNNGNRYCDFFYPEIKKFLDKSQIEEIEAKLLSKKDNIFDQFDEKRHKGENDSYICTLIREDSIKDFIIHVNQTNINLKSKIVSSIFETNPFLNEKNPTLIEYAAFFGSIQIFRYLMMNQVELTPSLWLYTIHSKNAELIHLLESINVPLPKYDNTNIYTQCLIESIKCHHNDICEYIKINFIEFDKLDSKDYEKTISSILYYHNYFNFPNDFDTDDEFFYLCEFKYEELVRLFVKKKEKFIIELIKENNFVLKQSDKTNYNVLIFYYSMLKQKKIETRIYENNLAIKKIAIPSSVTSIGDYAFNKCSSLTQITIPSSVTSIGDYAFNKCSSLTKITIPSSVTKIGDYAFNKCSSLTQITIPSSVTKIGNHVFFNCSSLTKITIPSSVTKIGRFAIRYCSSLTKITIPSSVTKIGSCAFVGCSSLTQITIPSSVTKIGSCAFVGCSSLTQITISSSLTLIENFVFSDCSSLTQITIPSSVTKIGNSAFDGCLSLKQIAIPSSVTEIGHNAFKDCSSLTQITIPSSVTSIGDSAFSRCSSLTQIAIPSSVIQIGGETFRGCSSLARITIPSFINLNNLLIPPRTNIITF